MGLGNYSGNRVYLNIKEGELAMKKDGQTHLFDHVSGVITDLSIQDGKFGKELHVTLTDGPETYILQMKFDGGYSRSFLMAIKNTDLKRPVMLVPKYRVEGERKLASLLIIQDQKGVKWFYTKENPRDCPQPVQVKYKGQLQWDNTDQMLFLEKLVLNDIKPLLVPAAIVPAPVAGEDVQQESAETSDDLPF